MRIEKPEKRAGVALPVSLDRHRILTIAQFAELLNLSTSQVRRLYRAGRLPAPIAVGLRKLGYTVGTAMDLTSRKEAA